MDHSILCSYAGHLWEINTSVARRLNGNINLDPRPAGTTLEACLTKHQSTQDTRTALYAQARRARAHSHSSQSHSPPLPEMAPLCPVFAAESLPDRVNVVRRNFIEKKRKGTQIDLNECPLMEMTQYSCNPPQEGIPQPGQVVCKPIVRLFRR